MHYEDSFVLFSICLIFSANYFLVPNEILELSQSVRDFLRWGREEGDVAKAISNCIFVGGAAMVQWGGRTSAEKTKQHRDFDNTKGFPGEDIDNF